MRGYMEFFMQKKLQAEGWVKLGGEILESHGIRYDKKKEVILEPEKLTDAIKVGHAHALG